MPDARADLRSGASDDPGFSSKRPLTRRLSGDSVLSRYLGLLKSEQSDYAVDALKNPKERDAFEYGERCGTLAGLVRAEQLLVTALGEENDE